jgi:hypothetical protein
MSRCTQGDSPKDAEAIRLIRDLAVRLLALAEGKPIPKHWQALLKQSLLPKSPPISPQRFQKMREVVSELSLAAEELEVERSALHSKTAIFKRIGNAVGVSYKTVGRIEDCLPMNLNQLALLDGMRGEQRRAYIDGMADAICARLREDDQAEELARAQRYKAMILEWEAEDAAQEPISN